jgi:hypothetical protein
MRKYRSPPIRDEPQDGFEKANKNIFQLNILYTYI